ncbi:MAG: heavy-metal-associated domain-containing protein [Actinomycetota bacterium]
MSTITFSVPGMTCGHCEQAVSSEIGKLPGVTEVDVNLETKVVKVSSQQELAWSVLVAAVDEAGFEAVSQ